MANANAVQDQFELILHIAVDWNHQQKQLVGFAIHQQVHNATTSKVVERGDSTWYGQVDPSRHHISTLKESHLTAILHAFRHALRFETQSKAKVKHIRLKIWHKQGAKQNEMIEPFITQFIKNPNELYPVRTPVPADPLDYGMHMTMRQIIAVMQEIRQAWALVNVPIGFEEGIDTGRVAMLLVPKGDPKRHE